ncbi:lytic transglycosylase domain-containing protein [Algihabitans albus]|uniref:lytic transglycosylase domain-containing protein n=1 Tax=Algihabitans albus TaxID=2164067 RepID=UPI001F1D9A19|nr:lytic transglycosylase domain-containing protein [Algihabitans albus]
MQRLPLSGRTFRTLLAALTLFTLPVAAALPARAELTVQAASTPTGAVHASSIDRFIAEAARRFDIPVQRIRAVMQAESAGNRYAVSSAGAMGLMQIMPETWRELRTLHGLGVDPFDPRDNILAGAAYLRAMYDRFGAPGFLAAYNAGPGRYAEHLATGRPLPRETRAYLATLAPLIDGSGADRQQEDGAAIVVDWRAAPLFVMHIDGNRGASSVAGIGPSGATSNAPHNDDRAHAPRPPNGLFVRSATERGQ